jgi:hypothetical protein
LLMMTGRRTLDATIKTGEIVSVYVIDRLRTRVLLLLDAGP